MAYKYSNNMSSFFEELGRKLGRAAVPTFQKTKWVWDGLTGTEEEALQAEKELGTTLAAELRQTIEIIDDPLWLSRIRGLCNRLQESVGQPEFQYHCELMQAEHPAAIALPGGYLFVSRSLIDFCEGKPDELAFVVAHETAHLIRRHTWDRMVQQSALRAASFVTRRAGFLASWLQSQGLPLLRNAHSQESEFDADKDGIGLARAAGYDPNGAISFLKRIEQLGTDPEVLGEYLASHPAPAERLSRLESSL
jgi:predicted Zn-dependent protease